MASSGGTKLLEKRCKGHNGAVWALHAGSLWAVSSGDDSTVRVWQVAGVHLGRCLRTLQHSTAPVRALAVDG